MRDVSIGQYYPSGSVVHRLDARVKLILVIVYITMVFFINTYVGYGIMLLFLIFLIALSKVPPLKVMRSLRSIFYLLLFTAAITILFYRGDAGDILWEAWIIKIYRSALIISSKMALRLMLLVLGPSILTLTTTPVELTDALERLLKPLTYIKLPVHELAIIMSIALRLIPAIMEETDKIIGAQKARGAQFDSGNIFARAKALIPVIIPLFISSFRRADELAYAIDSRCYRGAKGRTRMKVMRLSFKDFAAMFLFAAVFFVLLNLAYNFFGLEFINTIVNGGF